MMTVFKSGIHIMPFKYLLTFFSLGLCLAITACTTTSTPTQSSYQTIGYPLLNRTASYSLLHDGGFTIPAIPSNKIAAHYRRKTVTYPSKEEPGTILVDTKEKYLY